MITNLVNNKKYIGQTKRDIKLRFKEHIYNKNEILYRVKQKYGIKNLIIEVLEGDINKKDIDEKERFYIKEYKCLTPDGYNLSIGGQSNKSMSKKARKSLSSMNMGVKNPKSKGRILMICIETKEVLQIFDSTREAGRYLGSENKYRAIVNCANGTQEKALGYIWKYENEK